MIPRPPPSQRITDAAVELFARQSIASTDIRAIVASAGVTLRTFYRCFPTKRALVEHVLRENPTSNLELHDLPRDPTALIETVARRELRATREDVARARIVAREALANDPVAITILDTLADEWRDRWAALLGDSDVREGVDVMAAAEVIRAALWGLVVVDLGHDGTWDVDSRITMLAQIVGGHLSGPRSGDARRRRVTSA